MYVYCEFRPLNCLAKSLPKVNARLRPGAGRDFVFSSDFGSFPNLIC